MTSPVTIWDFLYFGFCFALMGWGVAKAERQREYERHHAIYKTRMDARRAARQQRGQNAG